MKVFKIGVWVDQSFIPEYGGGYSYLWQLIGGIDEMELKTDIEIYFVGFNLSYKFNKKTINLPFTESFFEKKRTNFYHKLFKSNVPRRDLQQNFTRAESILKNNEIDLIFYPTPYVVINNYPYMIVNWDLGHKTTYPFPETAMYGNAENREHNIFWALNKAILIACESESGKMEIIENYRIFEKKIRILPLFPGKLVSNNVTSTTPSWLDDTIKFFLYPAQFWAHKNHYNLILAFASFIKKNPEKKHKLVLTGSNNGNQEYIKKLINELKIGDQIVIPGFIDEKELKWLYKNAIGLVFPTFLGPTNMPLLEAHYLNCNIACSNLQGHIDMIGNNAIYFEPENPNSILDALVILDNYCEKGKKTKKTDLSNDFKIENSLEILKDMFQDSINIRRTWDI